MVVEPSTTSGPMRAPRPRSQARCRGEPLIMYTGTTSTSRSASHQRQYTQPHSG